MPEIVESSQRLPFRFLQKYPRNTSVLLITEPLWSFPANWFFTYFTLFMAQLGLTPVQIGLVTSLGMGSRIICSLIGGRLADHWGRKKTLIIFDIVSWLIPMLIWALATRFWHFALNAVLNNLVWVANPAWLCLMLEEARDDQRTRIFALNHSIFFIGGLTLPLAGWMVNRYGIVPGMRLIIWIFFGCLALMILLRAFWLRESHIGLRRREEARQTPGLAGYRNAFRLLIQAGYLRTLLLISIMYNFGANMAGTYNALYITAVNGLALPKEILVVLPIITSILTALVTLSLIPRIPFGRETRFLLYSQIFNLAGFLLFLLAPVKSYLMVILNTVFWGIAGGLYVPVREGMWQNKIPEGERASVIALAGVLECLIILPAAPLGGWIFEQAPRLVYFSGGFICLVLILMIFRSFREQHDRAHA